MVIVVKKNLKATKKYEKCNFPKIKSKIYNDISFSQNIVYPIKLYL